MADFKTKNSPVNSFTQKLVIIILLLFTALSCHEKDSDQGRGISEILNNLNQRTYQDAFVIFEAGPVGNFIQFFNGNEGLFFDFTVKSVAVKNSPDTQQVGEILDSPPQLEGDLFENQFISSDQKHQLRELLREYDLKYDSTFQIGLEPGTDRIVGYFEIIRGEFSIDEENYDQFLNDVFEKVFGLEDFEISYIEN